MPPPKLILKGLPNWPDSIALHARRQKNCYKPIGDSLSALPATVHKHEIKVTNYVSEIGLLDQLIGILGGDGDSDDIGIVALPEVGFNAGVSHGRVVGCLASFTLFNLMLHNTVR